MVTVRPAGGGATVAGLLLRLKVMPRTDDTNPLLDVEFRIPFDRIRAEHVQPAASELLRQARTSLASLAAPNGEPSFDSTLLALDTMTEALDWAMGVVRHPEIGRALRWQMAPVRQ